MSEFGLVNINRLLAEIKPEVMGWINQAQLGGSAVLKAPVTLPDNVAYLNAAQTFTAVQWLATDDIMGKVIFGSSFFEPSDLSKTSGRLALGALDKEELFMGSPAFTWYEDASGGNQAIHIEGDNKRAVLRLRRSDGTFDTPAAIAAANEVIGGIFADGYLTDTWPSSSLASVQFLSGQAFTNSHGGTYIRINTTPIDSVTAASVVWIREDGKVGIGDSTPDSLLELGAASGAGYITLNEVSAPSSPAADKLAIYAKDNGSGTTKLYIKDSAGTETELGSGSGVSLPSLSGTSAHLLVPWGYGLADVNADPGGSNTVRAIRFFLPVEITVASLHFEVTGGNAAGRFCGLALYDGAGTTQLATTGAVDATSTGVKSVTLGSPVTLPAGMYWIAWTANNSNVTFKGCATTPTSFINSGSTQSGTSSNSSSGGAPPSSLGTISAATFNSAKIKLQGA